MVLGGCFLPGIFSWTTESYLSRKPFLYFDLGTTTGVRRISQKFIVVVVFIIAASALGWMIFNRLEEQSAPQKWRQRQQPIPVEVAAVQHGAVELRRTFSGTLESTAELIVAPKISGRVEGLNVGLGDTVRRNQVVAELDHDEYVQAVVLAEADIEVVKANLAEARSALEITSRRLNRMKMLRKRNVTSDSEFDLAKAEHLAKQARLEVSKAQLTRAKALLATAKIRLGYTKVRAGWKDSDKSRVVAERFVDEGETVSANAPLFSIVDLDPIKGVIFATEKDYTHLKNGQSVFLTTDAYPGEQFPARISRIAPVFRKTTRQARIELKIKNPHHRLKPGMFIRATVVLDRIADATIVPEQALTTRNEEDGVFVVGKDGKSVVWCKVKVGIREGNRVQVEGKGLSERVVTLGQQLVENGSSITIAEKNKKASTPGRRP